jgi:ParB family chromosome partitioning protein
MDIPVKLIDIGKSQSRQRNVNEGIEELAESIKVLGQQQPVKVVKRPNNRYELVAGQRRFIAIRDHLKQDKIWGEVIPQPEDPIKLKAISFAENFIRQPLVNPDIIDACAAFLRRYGTIAEASRQLGLPYYKVRDYVKYDGLPEELKKMVDDKRVKIDTAHKATLAATKTDLSVDIEKAKALAPVLERMSGTEKKKLMEEAQSDPEAPLQALLESATHGEQQMQLAISLATREFKQLKKYTSDNKLESEAAAASTLVVDSLKDKGYSPEQLAEEA